MVLYIIQLSCLGGMVGCALHDRWYEYLSLLLVSTVAAGFSELCKKIEKLDSAKSAQAENTEK